MPEDIRISLFNVVGSPFCVASSDGQKIYDHVTTAFKANRGIALSFRNVTTLTAAFLNAAIGQLYGIFSEEQIRSRLKVVDVETGRSCVVEPRRRHRQIVLQRFGEIRSSHSRNNGRRSIREWRCAETTLEMIR